MLEPIAAHGEPVYNDMLRECMRQLRPMTGHKPPRLGKHRVPGKPVWARDAIAIQKDDVLARRLENGLVVNPRFAKPVIRVPDVMQGGGTG